MAKEKVGGSKKPRQSTHNKLTGKYVRQRVRTEANKARNKEKYNKGGDA